MKTSPRLSLAAAAAAGILAITGVAAVAQDGDTPTDTESTESTETTREERQAEREATFSAALAEELGIDEATVAEAVSTVREELRAAHQAERLVQLEERLAARVADGDLTQEQADTLLELAESGDFPGRGGRRGHGPRGGGGVGADDAAVGGASV